MGLFAADSVERSFSLHENGLLAVEYPNDQVGQFVDPATGDVTILDEGRVVWSNDEGSRIGLWDRRNYDYRIEDLEGETYEALPEKELDILDYMFSVEREGHVVGLEEGLFQAVREVPRNAGQVEIAAFQGFESVASIDFTWNEEILLRLRGASSVPGAVVIPYYTFREDSGIIGIR